MLIEDIQLTQKGRKLVLSASVQFQGQLAEIMYFATDADNSTYIAATSASNASDASPFLAAVLLPCMKTGENIFINGSIPKKLLANSEKIMKLVEGWNVGMKHVNLYVSHTTEERKRLDNKKQRNASFFSAGVDSFYTYLKHTDQKVGNITDFILVHGFDIPLSNQSLFNKVKQSVKNIALQANVQPLFVETNLADIVERKLVWDFAHGGALAAVALFLRKQLNTVYIAGAVNKKELFPYGTHPQLDRLWSTETTTFRHDGTEYNRLGKITNAIAYSELALDNLRVCTQNFKGKYNCSRCHKCLTTMIMLICAGAQNDAKTFTWPIDLHVVKNMYYDYSLQYNQQGEASLKLLRDQNREQSLQQAIAESLEKSKKPKLTRVISKAIATWDQNSNNRRLYQFIFKVNNEQDRNALFKLVYRLGVLK